MPDGVPEGYAVCRCAEADKRRAYNDERGVVSCPLVVRLFVVRRMPVREFRVGAQLQHEPRGVLEVHLPPLDDSA